MTSTLESTEHRIVAVATLDAAGCTQHISGDVLEHVLEHVNVTSLRHPVPFPGITTCHPLVAIDVETV